MNYCTAEIIVLYSLTRATLMSPGKDEIRVCGYIYLKMSNHNLFKKTFYLKPVIFRFAQKYHPKAIYICVYILLRIYERRRRK